MKLLIVDDSIVFRSQIKAALEGIENIVVVTTAANGKIALDKLEQNSIDVVISDIEMPEMDGITMIKEMRNRKFPQKVIVFASTTQGGIDLLFTALNAGASDFIAKPHSSGSLEEALEGIKKELIPKILQFQKKSFKDELNTNVQKINSSHNITPENKEVNIYPQNKIEFRKPKVIGIGSSTGGPAALDSIFLKLKGVSLKIPIFIAQHMPPKFTDHLAQHLESLCGHPTHEGKHGEIIKPGHIYVAPGDFHMTVEKSPNGENLMINLDQGPKRNSVRPAVDNLFESLAKIFDKNCAVFVLTGMGEDGLQGVKAIKNALGTVMIQDEKSSVVWGMPGAIHASGMFDAMGNLEECAKAINHMIQ